MRFTLFCIAACVAAFFGTAGVAARAAGAPWIALSDVHYGPGGRHPGRISPPGSDTNDPLLNSLLDELHRAEPNPPVVIIAGDFLAHRQFGPAAAPVFAYLAKRFDQTYPHAQFIFTLGNDDSPCGDYAVPIGGRFLAAVARAWEPLVNRNGAAPGFVRSFSRDGSYVARLPVPGLQAVVINDVSFSVRYNASCANGENAANAALSDAAAALRAQRPGGRSWLLLHVPPGIDAYSTVHLTHHLAVIPFMRPRVREAFDALVEDPRNHVALVVGGHTHKFAYRVAEGGTKVPILLVPSVSPIFFNSPSFLKLGLDRDGTLVETAETSYLDGKWQTIGDFASLGIRRIDAAQLLEAQRRLAQSPDLRARFSRLYSGGGPAEIDESNWRSYWCAATAFASTAFQQCEGSRFGWVLLTHRGLVLLGAGAVALLAVLLGAFAFVRVRMRSGRAGSRV